MCAMAAKLDVDILSDRTRRIPIIGFAVFIGHHVKLRL